MLHQHTLLICAYIIAFFDLLCAVFFTALCLTMVVNYMSWLIIFSGLFGTFWLSLIIMLIAGIYNRRPQLVRCWLLFSGIGILLETCLLIYAFLAHTTIHNGTVKNVVLLVLSLFIEMIFVFIIFKFYVELQKCKPDKLSLAEKVCKKRKQCSSIVIDQCS